LLADERLPANAPEHSAGAMRVEGLGIFDDSTPSFVLGRVTIGRLVSLGASIRLRLSKRVASSVRGAIRAEMPETQVEFTLQSTALSEPDEISQLLGLTPTMMIRVGQIQPTVKLPSPRTAWQLKSNSLHAWTFDPLVRDLLSTLQLRADAIASLTTHRFDGILSLVGHFADQSPEVNLTAEDLRLIRKLGLEVDVDLST
jgi:hypothetical protein